MAFTEAEMKARWKAGIQDLNGDGKIVARYKQDFVYTSTGGSTAV